MEFTLKKENNIEYYTVPELYEAGFYNIFTTKRSGTSFEGGELNFGTTCNDTEENIETNYANVLSLMNLRTDQAVRSLQTHSDITLEVGKKNGGEGILFEQSFQEADGLITREKDLAISIYFADCVPVLIADQSKKICCAVHSGWKGTYKNIAGKAVEKLILEYGCNPSDFLCAIGPSIGVCDFEVSEDLYQEMTTLYGAQIGVIKNNKFYLDLKRTVKEQLLSLQIPASQIAVSPLCTVCTPDLYSFRREGDKSGRMAAFIGRID